MSLLSKKFKREHFPVSEADGLFVRPSKHSEQQRALEIPEEADKIYFTFGITMTDEQGSPLFVKSPDETDQQFAVRVKLELDDADFDGLMFLKVCNAIGKIQRYEPETIQKN